MNIENHRVLMFIKGMDLGGYSGGADLFGINLALALRENGIDIELCVCFKFDTASERRYTVLLKKEGLKVHFLLDWIGKTSFKDYSKALDNFSKILLDRKFNIVHSHFHIGTLIAVILKLKGQVNYVVRTVHVDREWERGWDSFFQQIIIRLLIFVAFTLFVNREAGVSSSSVAVLNSRILARLLGKRAVIIHNAIPDPVNTGNLQLGANWRTSHPVIGSVGRLEEQKGYTYFIEAIPGVLKDYPNAEFWLIGDGKLGAGLRKLSQELMISDHIRFFGKRDDVADLLGKMDLFVSSSIYEGLPTVVLEAMAGAVPVVASDIPGTRDIVQHRVNSFVVTPKDSQALAEAIKYVLGDLELRKALVAGGFATLRKFSIGKISQEYIDVYNQLRAH